MEWSLGSALQWIILLGLAGCRLSIAQNYSSATTTTTTKSTTNSMNSTTLGQTCQYATSSPELMPRGSNVSIPPLIVLEPERDLVFREYSSIELPCVANGTPPPKYRWQMNEKDFDPSGNDGRIAIQPGVGTLIFARALSRDEAIYQCFAYNDFGTALTVKVNLRQAVLQPFQKTTIKYNSPSLGSSLQLRCIPPTSFPKADVFWATIAEGSNFTRINLSDRVIQDPEGNLDFVNILAEDFKNSSTYTCIAENNAMRSIQQGEYNKIIPRGVATVYYKPAIMWQSPIQQVAVRGATVTIVCIFSANPTARVDWIRIDEPMSERARVESFGPHVTIENVQYDDAGRYECQGINDQTMVPIRRSFNLSVESAPYWITKPESVDVAVNETATFTCIGEGIPNPNYTWFLNGVPITQVPSDPRRTATENTLTFTNVSMEDTMVIQCNVSNKYGYNFTNAYLNVLEHLNDTSACVTDIKTYSSTVSTPTTSGLNNSASVVFWGEYAKMLLILVFMFPIYDIMD